MVTQTFTLKEFQGYLQRLPTKLEKYSGDINMEIARDLQKRIRLRAPKGNSPWSTGSLKKIELNGTPKKVRLVGPPHWNVVDKGIVPDSKFIPVELLEGHKGNPGSTVGQSVGNNFDTKGFIYVQGPRPGKGFVTDSIRAQEGQIPKIIERGLSKAFSK